MVPRLGSLAGGRLGSLAVRLRRGPALLAWAIDGRHDWAVLILEGRLDWRSGPILAAAWRTLEDLHPGRIAIEMSGIRTWDAHGLARLLEVAAGTPGVSAYGAGARLRRSLAAAQLGWELVSGHCPAEPVPAGTLTGGSSQADVEPLWHVGPNSARSAPGGAPGTFTPSRAGLAAGQAGNFVLAAFVLFALAPFLGLIALAIWLDSPGPVMYTQLRAGRAHRDGSVRVFKLYKFRTMVDGADALRMALRAAATDGPFFKLKGDPRITRMGRWLRAWSLDELPQLLNVLLGDMSLVGNRPLPLDEAEMLAHPWQRARFQAPAGLTGLWQVCVRSECTPRTRLALDTAYAVARSPWLDLQILAATVPAVICRKGW